MKSKYIIGKIGNKEVKIYTRDFIIVGIILLVLTFLANLTINTDFSFITKKEQIEKPFPIYAVYLMIINWAVTRLFEWVGFFIAGLYVGRWYVKRKVDKK